MTVHKELIEVLEHACKDTSSEERLVLVTQAFKIIESRCGGNGTAALTVDGGDHHHLDIVKWMVSYTWNQGVQMYKQLDENEARAWLNLSISMLRKTKEMS